MLLRFGHLRLLPAPLALCLIDMFLTLRGQSSYYWQGNFAAVNEGSPEVHRMLACHPLAFAAGTLVWIALFTALLLLLPRACALFLATGVAISHATCASTWLRHWTTNDYQVTIGLCLFAAFILVASLLWDEAKKAQTPTSAAPYDVRREGLRWSLIVLLAVGPILAFLWPH